MSLNVLFLARNTSISRGSSLPGLNASALGAEYSRKLWNSRSFCGQEEFNQWIPDSWLGRGSLINVFNNVSSNRGTLYQVSSPTCKDYCISNCYPFYTLFFLIYFEIFSTVSKKKSRNSLKKCIYKCTCIRHENWLTKTVRQWRIHNVKKKMRERQNYSTTWTIFCLY